MLETQLSIREKFLIVIEIFLISLISQVIVFGLIIHYVLEYFGINYSVETKQSVLILVSALWVPFVVFLRIKHYQKHEYWTIQNDRLIRGRDKSFVIDLNSIEAAAVGIPKKNVTNQLMKIFAHRAVQAENSAIEWTLVLKLNDKMFFPLYLYVFNGGDKLMEYVYSILEARLDKPHTFTESEVTAFKRCKVNKMVFIK